MNFAPSGGDRQYMYYIEILHRVTTNVYWCSKKEKEMIKTIKDGDKTQRQVISYNEKS